MEPGARATHRAAVGAVGAPRSRVRPGRRGRAALVAALLLALGAAAGPGCSDCRGTSFDPNVCRSDLDCPAAEACSPGGVCGAGAGECTELAECPAMAPARCADSEVACRGGACRYDQDCLKLGGRVSGLIGRGLVLGNGTLRVEINGDASFEFDALFGHGDAYDVVIAAQPRNPGQTCIVSDGGGRFNVSDVATVRVTCAFLPEDQDGDRICDGETLSDACINILDNCVGLSNPDQSDRDLDGVGDACDPCTDRDQDGYGRPGLDQSGCLQAGDDCDDDEVNAHPGLIERCGDGLDNDCDGLTDELGCQRPYAPPVAVADRYAFDEDHAAVELDVLANDTVWEDPTSRLTITGTTAPSASGTLSIISGGARLRYTPRPNYHGEETFAYSVSDGVGGLSSATVTLTLAAVNDPPTAGPDSFVLAEDSPVATLDVLGNDTCAPDEGEPLSVIAIGQPSAGGTVSLLLGGNIQYRPRLDYSGVETFTYILSDATPGSTAVGHVTVTLTPVNDAPKLVFSLPDQVLAEDVPWTFTVPPTTFVDVDAGDLLTLTAALADSGGLPSWLSFDPLHGTFTGTPTNANVGQLLLEVRATDLAGAAAVDAFALTVVNTNDAPVVAVPLLPQIAFEGTPWSYVVPAATFTDVDANDTLTYRATRADGTALPAWLAFDRTLHLFTGTPSNDDVGALDLIVVATDRANAAATAPLTLTVLNVNQAPTVAHPLADREATEDTLFVLVVPADTFADADPDDATLAFAARRADGSALPVWLTFTAATRRFEGTPRNADVGALTLTVVATDSAGATASDTFELIVRNTNDPPELVAALVDRSVDEGVSFAWSVVAGAFVDPDLGDTLSYAATGPGGAPLPAWLSFDPAQGLLHGTPTNATVGDHVVVLTATDVAGASVSDAFVLRVNNVNAPPRVATGLVDRSATEDAAFSATLPTGAFADDDPGDVITLSATRPGGAPLPAWLTFDAPTATFWGTPANADVGPLILAVTATDFAGASVTALFTLTVANTNDAPRAAVPLDDRTILEDLAFTWVLPAAAFVDDDAGDTLTWAVARPDGGARPAWLSFDPAARLLAGTPTNADVGPLALRVTVTDAAGASASGDLVLTVQNTNDAPTAVAPLDPVAATEDAPFTWTLPAGAFVDVDAGDVLAYSAARADGAALPAWLSFDPAARRLAGTPRNEHVGPLVLALRAVDLAGATATAALTLTVVNTNDPPVLVAPIADRTVTARSGFAFFIPPGAFADPDVGDVLTFHVTLDGEDGLPPWITFDAPERVFYGTPQDGDVGDYVLSITAIDQGGLAVASAFHVIVVAAPPGDLVVARAVADQIATEDVPYSFTLPVDTFAGGTPPRTVAARGLDGAPLPGWLSFDGATFAGTPGNADVGVLAVEVVASDLAGASAADAFVFTVVNSADAPIATAAVPAQSATVGATFAFVLPAGLFVDVDPGDALTLTVARADGAPAPAWLAFYPASGLFLGAPGALDEGRVTLRVTARDLTGLSAFVDFDLTVTPATPPAAAPGDLRAPRVLRHDPPGGAVIGVHDAVSVRFDEPVDPATVAPGACTLVDDQLGAVPGVWDERAGAWVFVPDAPLAPGPYAVFVDAGVRDLAGHPLDESGPEDDFSFTVAAGFGAPAWRQAPPDAGAALLDVLSAGADDGVVAVWLEQRAENLVGLRARASLDGGASWTAAVDGGAEVALGGRIVAVHKGVAAAFDVLWMADERIVMTRCTGAGSCVAATLGHHGAGVAGAASAAVWSLPDAAGVGLVGWWDAPGAAGGAGLRVRRAAGAGWGPIETVDLGQAVTFATLGAAGDGVAAVWEAGGVVRWRGLRADGTWTPAEVAATAVTGALATPAAALGAEGGGLVAWAEADGGGGAWQVHVVRRAGGLWAPSVRAAAAGGSAVAPDGLVAGLDAAGRGFVAWQVDDPTSGATRAFADVFDGTAWRGVVGGDPSGGAAAAGAALVPPALVGGALAGGQAVVLVGYGDAAVGGPQLAALTLDLDAGGASWSASALLGPFAPADAGPWAIDGLRWVSDGAARVGFVSALGVGAARLGEGWATASARDLVFGADVAEGAPEDGDLVQAGLAFDARGARAVVAVTGDALGRVVAGGLGGGAAGRAELGRRASGQGGATSARDQALALAVGADGARVVARLAAGAVVPGAGACGAVLEPVTMVGFEDGPGGGWGAPVAVGWRIEELVAPAAGCAAVAPSVVGQGLAVDGEGRALVVWRLDGAGADAAVRVARVDAGSGEVAAVVSAATGPGASGPAEVDTVRVAAAGTVAAVVIDDPSGGAGQGGARAVGVFADLAALDGGDWTSTATLWPDAAAVDPGSAAVAVAEGGPVWVVAGVSEALDGAAAGRLAGWTAAGGWVSTVLTSGGGAAEAPRVWPRVTALAGGAARVWLETTAGEPALEAWEVAGPGAAATLRGRLALGTAAVRVLDVAVRADGAAVAVWTVADGAAGSLRLWAAAWTAAEGWSAPALVRDPAGLGLDGARVGLDAAGHVVVAWREARADGTHAALWAAAALGALEFAGGSGATGEVTLAGAVGGGDVVLPLGWGGPPFAIVLRAAGEGGAARYTSW